MSESKPPPTLETTKKSSLTRQQKLLIRISIGPAIVIGLLIVLRLLGLLRPFQIPTSAMDPSMVKGNKIVIENISYLAREPVRGDIVVFKTTGIFPINSLWTMRVVGEPGERVQFEDGKLLIDGEVVAINNSSGEIIYEHPDMLFAELPYLDTRVPDDSYFVVGDNSKSSNDSRSWGYVPRENIIGRVFMRYWPPSEIGSIE